MTPEERARVDVLCTKLQVEHDPGKFSEYVRELNEVLDAKEQRFAEDCKKDLLLRPPIPR
jgi:hypothetical protein